MSALRTYVWTALLALAWGCGSPLVGLECQDGLERCGNACYDLVSDSLHCGGCNIACNADQHCALSMCVAGPAPDAGADGGADAGLDATLQTDGAIDANVEPDGRIVGPDGETLQPDGNLSGDATTGDGGDDDAGDPDAMVQPPVLCTGAGSPSDCVCGIGVTKCLDTCVDLTSDRNNCGMCGEMCAADEFCNQGECSLICTPPVVLCNGACVDFTSDDANCGSCGFACSAAAQCIDSVCVGAAVGHVVVIGHDMSGPLRPAIRQIVSNAVFLAPRSPVRALIYDAATSVASRAGVSAAITAASAVLGRAVVATTALPANVTAQLATSDVLVIEPQQGATNGELAALGSSWSAALSDFLFRGGVVVLFDGGPDTGDLNDGTWQVLRSATKGNPPEPLFDATGSTSLTQRILRNVRPGDAIGGAVSTEYLSAGETVGFTLDSSLANPHNVVIQDTLGATPSNLPVVVHVVFSPL
ncbi:MAG: hypothetical protein ABW352_10795 [Polyangiales bacterium]